MLRRFEKSMRMLERNKFRRLEKKKKKSRLEKNKEKEVAGEEK